MPLALLLLASQEAQAKERQAALFSGLDKVTARVSRFKVAVGQAVRFGDLRVTLHACHETDPPKRPESMAFMVIEAVGVEGDAEQIFSGWMLASSPGLHAVEHPVFDVWLAGCI